MKRAVSTINARTAGSATRSQPRQLLHQYPKHSNWVHVLKPCATEVLVSASARTKPAPGAGARNSPFPNVKKNLRIPTKTVRTANKTAMVTQVVPDMDLCIAWSEGPKSSGRQDGASSTSDEAVTPPGLAQSVVRREKTHVHFRFFRPRKQHTAAK